jgi:hypothetical protein
MIVDRRFWQGRPTFLADLVEVDGDMDMVDEDREDGRPHCLPNK